jgi:hypothetical protein
MSVEDENDGNESDEAEYNTIFRYIYISILCFSLLYYAHRQDLKV